MLILFRRFFAGASATAVLLLSGGALAKEFKLGALEINNPWSRATPAGAKVAAGYFVIKNNGAAPDRLVSVSVEIAGRATIHEMAMTNGVMTMRALPDGLAIPAHGEIALKPGAYHLMLEQLKAPLKEGESFSGALTFEKAGEVDVTFSVEGMGAKQTTHQDHESEPNGGHGY
jgi:periplasmic copper chaperone A